MDSSSSTSTGTGSDFVQNDDRTKKGAMKIGTGTKKGRKLSVQFATNKPLSPAQNLVLQAEINDLPEKVNDIEMALSSEESTIFIHVPEGNSIDVDASLVVEPRKSKRRFAKAPIEASPPKPQSSNRAAILPDNSDDSIIVPKRRGRRKAVAPEFPPEGTEALQKLLEGNRRNKKKQKEEKDGRSENQNEPRVPAEQEVVLPDNSDGSIIVPKRKGRRKVVAPEFPPEGIEALKKLLEENRRKKMNQENEKDGCSTGRNEPNVPLEREASPNQPHMEAEEIRNSSEMEQPQNLLLMSLAQPENTDTAVTIPFIPIAPEYSSIPVDPLHETHPSKKSSKIPVATKRSSKMTAGQGKTPVKTKRPKKSLPYTKKRKNSKSPNKPAPKNNDVEMAAQFADGTSAGPVSVIEDDDGTRDDAPAVSQTDDDGSSISQEYVSIVEDQHQSKLLSKPGVTSNTSGLSHIGRNVEHPNEEGEGTLPMDADVGIENDSVFTDIEDSNDGENEPDLDRINEEEVEEVSLYGRATDDLCLVLV
ncbi:titin homolog isoform X2 [Artemia franciscana]|uniref:titin homolog isoform X2 n=1 Tax=Artemia franciscana TaxID=6661 RepID=UPI0032DB7472